MFGSLGNTLYIKTGIQTQMACPVADRLWHTLYTGVPLCICLKLLGARSNGQQNDIPVQRFIRNLFVKSSCVLDRFLLFCNEQEAMFIKRNSVQEHQHSQSSFYRTYRGSGGKSSDLHSGGIRFENRLKYGLFPSAPPSKCQNGERVDHDQYLCGMSRLY